MREANRYEPLKDAHRQDAGQGQETPQDERPNPERYETLKAEPWREPGRAPTETQPPQRESGERQDNGAESYMTEQDRYEANLAAKTQELQAEVDAGKITRFEMGHALRKFDNEAMVAARSADGPQRDRDPQRDGGQAEARAQDGERAQRPQAGQEHEAEAAPREQRDGSRETTDARQAMQDKMARFREMMNESERGQFAERSHGDGGHER